MLLLLLLLVTPVFAVVKQDVPLGAKVRPVDEAAREPSFVHFRNELIKTARKANLEGVLSVLDRNVRVTHMGATGVHELKRVWDITRNDDAGARLFLSEVLRTLELGGRFNRQRTDFTAPYTYTDFPGPPKPRRVPVPPTVVGDRSGWRRAAPP